MPKQKKPTFADDGYEINNGSRIRQIKIINGFYYYQVTLQRISGNPIRKSFIKVEQARSFTEEIRTKGADYEIKVFGFIDPHHIDAVKATILSLYNAGLRKVAHFSANHNDHAIAVETLVKKFIAEKQAQADHGKLPVAALDVLKRLSKEFGHRAADTVTGSELEGFLNETTKGANQRSHRLHISAFFNWAVAQDRLSFNPIGPTFVNDGYEINNGCRIQRIEITNGLHYYQVHLQKISGNHIRKSFISANQARSFARNLGVKGTDSGIKILRFIDPQRIDAVKASIVDLYNTNFRNAA